VAGTVDDDNLASVTVYNNTLDPVGEFEAQLRRTLFIARGVDVELGDNDLYALAVDKSSNEKRYPADPETYHTVTLATPPDLDYIFDANGCLVEVVEDATALKRYTYDHEKRLVSVVADPDGTPITLAEFAYDALGRRIIVKLYDDQGALDSTTRYIYDGDRVIEEHVDDTGWVLDAVYVHGLGVDNVLTITRDSETYYYHYDGIGSVTELTNAAGTLSQAYEYDAWGIPTVYDPDHGSHNRYLFTGREWDAALALYYYRARHYDPALGRFLQTDPAGYGASINLYVYAGSSPTVFVDPSGLRHDVNVDNRENWSRLHWFLYELTPVRMLGLRGKESQETSVISREEQIQHDAQQLWDRKYRAKVQEHIDAGEEAYAEQLALVDMGARDMTMFAPITEEDHQETVYLMKGLRNTLIEAGVDAATVGISMSVNAAKAPAMVGSTTSKARRGNVFRRLFRGRRVPLKNQLDDAGEALVTWGDEAENAVAQSRRSRNAAGTIISNTDEAAATLREAQGAGKAQRFWTKRVEFNGTRVYQRDDLFDIHYVDKQGRTNLQRMEQGYAPIGHDGNPVNVHHLTQDPAGANAEVSQAFHQRYFKIIHENTGQTPTRIDRAEFDVFRKEYWMHRRQQIRQSLEATTH
jgi:RHS repeat-associated protein